MNILKIDPRESYIRIDVKKIPGELHIAAI